MNPGLLIPEFIILGVASVALTLDFLLPRDRKSIVSYLAVAGLAAALTASLVVLGREGQAFGGFFIADGFTDFFRIIILGVGLLTAIASLSTFAKSPYEGEYYTLYLFALAGAMLMAGSGEIITLYLSIELLSLPAYALVAFRKASEKANDAVLKYFVLGILASSVILYSLSLLYGVTGETTLSAIGAATTGDITSSPIIVFASLLLLVGLGFKVAAVPFHWWAPDAYEGAPAQVAAFLAAVSKAAAFAALVRVFLGPLIDTNTNWELWFGALAATTMIVGTLLALPQTNIKRLLAFSSISHAGYILMGFAVATKLGAETLLFYIITYAFATAGSFFVVAAATKKAEAEDISDLAGLSQRNPALAFVMVIFLLSLIGIPPLAGFVGKLLLFGAVIDAGLIWLAVIGALATVASVGYYIRVIREMYLGEPNAEEAHFTPSLRVASYVALAAVVVMGVYAGPLVSLARAAASALGFEAA